MLWACIYIIAIKTLTNTQFWEKVGKGWEKDTEEVRNMIRDINMASTHQWLHKRSRLLFQTGMAPKQ